MNKSFVVPAFRRNNNDPLKPVPRTCCKQTLETTSQNGNPTRKRGASMLLILGGIIAIRQKPVLRTCCNQTLETTSPNGNPTRKRGASMLLMISRLRVGLPIKPQPRSQRRLYLPSRWPCQSTSTIAGRPDLSACKAPRAILLKVFAACSKD